MGILVTARRNLTAPQLIAMAAPLGMSATNVKSHLSRMVSEGVVQREGRARVATYGPSHDQAQIIEAIRERTKHKAGQPWDSTWLVLTLRFPNNRSQREHLRASLWFDGFRALDSNVFARPAWPLPWAEEQARQYSASCAGTCIRGHVVISAVDFGRLYDRDGLANAAHALSSRIRRRKVSSMSPRQAFAERIRIGGDAVQLLAHDPRLPRALWGSRRGMRELAEEFAKFEQSTARQAAAFVQEIVSGTSAAKRKRKS